MGPRFGQATGRQGTAARSPHHRSVPGTPGADRIRSKRLRRMWHIHHDAERGPPHRTTLLPGGAPAVDGPTSRDGQTRDRCARAATPRPSRPAARPPGAASQHRRCPDADADRREPRGRHPPAAPAGLSHIGARPHLPRPGRAPPTPRRAEAVDLTGSPTAPPEATPGARGRTPSPRPGAVLQAVRQPPASPTPAVRRRAEGGAPSHRGPPGRAGPASGFRRSPRTDQGTRELDHREL